ncbi:hypothetical protein E1176_11525 [Fulvivirga sp. RKSG066]|uniref:hypothetical protein n=1 Tax=Fulvivirga aurantia TaxID=2529383 RepID=UPI0012BCEE90|nr:hypothetical protein [Fulvivirga aurantia]MTI21651.1 hypothetical protein [Fulvivirga aurantia]
MKYLFLISICCLLALSGNSQDKKSNKENEKRANSFEPFTPLQQQKQQMVKKGNRNKSKKKSFRSIFNKQLKDKREIFYDLMEANAKKRKKMEREMQKPQYSDPSYFGHKRKPKKRPPGKRKFCKECKIVH